LLHLITHCYSNMLLSINTILLAIEPILLSVTAPFTACWFYIAILVFTVKNLLTTTYNDYNNDFKLV